MLRLFGRRASGRRDTAGRVERLTRGLQRLLSEGLAVCWEADIHRVREARPGDLRAGGGEPAHPPATDQRHGATVHVGRPDLNEQDLFAAGRPVRPHRDRSRASRGHRHVRRLHGEGVGRDTQSNVGDAGLGTAPVFDQDRGGGRLGARGQWQDQLRSRRQR